MGDKVRKYHDIMGSVGNLAPSAQRNYNTRRGRAPIATQQGKKQDAPDWWQEQDDRKAVRTAAKPSRRDALSLSSSESDISIESSVNEPLVSLDTPSPPYWSIGVIIILSLVMCCELIQYGNFAPISVNPMYGPSDGVLLQMGAKYGPFILEGDWYRFATAIFLSSGLIHLLISVVLILYALRVERTAGFWRAVFTFLIAGVYGYILSCIFIPNQISCGATGAVLGFYGMLLCDLLTSWRGAQRKCVRLVGNVVVIVALILLGLTPYFDNFMHLGGLVMGILCSIMFLPNLNFGKCERLLHGILAFIAFPVCATLFMICLVVFFRRVDNSVAWCKGCYKVNCVNISGWCPPVDDKDSIYRLQIISNS